MHVTCNSCTGQHRRTNTDAQPHRKEQERCNATVRQQNSYSLFIAKQQFHNTGTATDCRQTSTADTLHRQQHYGYDEERRINKSSF